MQTIFYNFDNKTALTLEQKENVIKVTVIAKKLLLFMLKHTSRKKLKMEHFFISHKARILFESLSDNLYKDSDTIEIIGNNYTIFESKSEHHFSIYKTTENKLLIKSNFSNYKIKAVNGLTDEDVKKWEQIGEILQVNFRDSVRRSNPK